MAAAQAPGGGAPALTFDTFREEKRTCGVRRVQQAYEQIAEEAASHGRTTLEEMVGRGHKNFRAFCQACPQFSLTCWPLEFAELGSGYVLYFHFVAMLAAVFGTLLLLQLPALVLYAQEDALCEWGGITDWQALYRTEGPGQNISGCHSQGGFIRSQYLTPGNLGPDAISSTMIPTVYTACVVAVCVLIFAAYQHVRVTEYKADARVVSPNDFAVLVRDLPKSATDERAIAEFFRQHAVSGKTDTEIVKVVIGWDAEEFREKIRQICELREKLKTLSPGDAEHGQVTARIKAIESELSSVAPDKASKLRSSGVVVVVFRFQSDMHACIQKWGSVQARWLYREAQDFRCLPSGNHLCVGEPLARYPFGFPPKPVFKLRIERAANPGDIHWEELGVDFSRKLKMQAQTNLRMACIVVICFFVTYGFNKVQDAVREAQEDFGSSTSTALGVIALLPAMGVAAANALLCMTAKRETAKEYHDTRTDEEFSQALKMTVGMVVNTAGVTYFCNSQPQEWYRSGGLVDDLISLLLVNCFMVPLVTYMDPGYALKGLMQRRHLTQAKLDGFNENLSKGPPTSKEELAERNRVLAEVEHFKKAHAPMPMNNARRYAVALKTFLCCLIYMPLLPGLSLVGLVALSLQYAVDKYLLLRWYSRPTKPSNGNMSMFSLQVVKLIAPLALVTTSFVFLCPSWSDKTEAWSNFYTALFLALCFSFFMPLSMIAQVLRPCLARSSRRSELHEADYYKAQYMWSTEMKYHKDQFIYKKLPASVNPEYLKRGDQSSVDQDVICATYSEATKQVAADAGAAPPTMTLAGGRVIADAADAAGAPAAPHAPPPAPPPPAPPRLATSSAPGGVGRPSYGVPTATVFGAASDSQSGAASPLMAPPGGAAAEPAEAAPPEPAPAPAPAAGDDRRHSAASSGPAASGAGGGGGGKPPRRSRSSGGANWEFEVRRGWEAFDSECQADLERHYQSYLAGAGPAEVHVQTHETHGRKISIHFDKMTSKLEGGRNRVRAIRRKETE